MLIQLKLKWPESEVHAQMEVNHEDLIGDQAEIIDGLIKSWRATRNEYLVRTIGPHNADMLIAKEHGRASRN